MTASVAAIDLGATSGRVILGTVCDGEIRMRHVARFPNEPVHLRDGLHWDILSLYRELLGGLTHPAEEILSIGIDSWAVDYGLLHRGSLLGIPYHYRDARTARGVAAVHARYAPAELYRRNGLQHLPFTTLFQLACDRDSRRLDLAERLLLIPDLIGYWLTGAEVAERTNASTTGLLNPLTGAWDDELIGGLGIPRSLLPPLVDPGVRIGAATIGGREIDVVAVGSHDTASAVVAIPNQDRDFAYVSCGTWGLVGLELDKPVLTDAARDANFTNEGGVDGRVRFLHNVMGLWLLSESMRTWNADGLDQLLRQAAEVTAPTPIIDVNHERFLAPGDIPQRITDWCLAHGLRPPASPPEVVRTIVESLAQAFADAVHTAARLASHPVRVIHLVGGGALNQLLCQATADRSGLPVLAGPVEATALGNVLIQARTAGMVTGDLADLRGIVARSFTQTRYKPRPG